MVIRRLIQGLIIVSMLFVWIQSVQASESSLGHGSSLLPLSSPEANIIYVPGPNKLNLQTAISQVNNWGIIEIADGTYYVPQGGFSIIDQAKSFTIRAATGATVILDGQGMNRLLNFQNSVLSSGRFVTFKGITFANGYTNADGIAAITMNRANSAFADCTFRNNRKTSSPGQTVGGAITIFGGSTVFFLNTSWIDNWSQNGGAAIGARDVTMYIHNSIFRNNQTEDINQNSIPGGAAVNLADSVVRITNTTFNSNQSAGHGAAIWALGNFGKATTDLIIANSTFVNNSISRNVPTTTVIEGGAIATEDNISARIYNSRFIENSAYLGGAMTIFRSKVEIYNSVFRGNRATDTLATSGFGGAINFNYYDRPDAASLLIEDTLIQGRYGAATTVAQFGGGLNLSGHTSTTLPKVDLRRVVFYDTDVHGSGIPAKFAFGGAISLSAVDFTMQDSFVLFSDAHNPLRGGLGGGIAANPNTQANIQRCVIAYNTADTQGGGLFANGSTLNVSGSTFYANDVSPSISEQEGYSYGAGAYVAPIDTFRANGVFANNLFVKDIGLAIYDDDRLSEPINTTVYNGNQFYENTFTSRIYKNTLLPTAMNPAGLNELQITHASGIPSIDKSLVNNLSLPTSPTIAKLIAVPSRVLANGAAGDPIGPTTAWLVYLWDGTSATLDGAGLTEKSSLTSVNAGGQHTLSVDGANTSVQIAQSNAPDLSTNITQGSPSTLGWNLTAGTYLDVAITQGLSLNKGSSGSISLPSDGIVYYLYMVTAEGGVVKEIELPPLLVAPTSITVVAGLNLPENKGYVGISNGGGQILQWTASTSIPGLIQLQPPTSGQTETTTTLVFTINSLSPGQYTAYISIDAGSAGIAQVVVNILVVPEIRQVFLPITRR